MKRRENYFLENRKKFFTWKNFLDLEKFSKNSKFWKNLKFLKKFEIIFDFIWLCLLIWNLSYLNLTLHCLEVREYSIFSYFGAQFEPWNHLKQSVWLFTILKDFLNALILSQRSFKRSPNHTQTTQTAWKFPNFLSRGVLNIL